MSNPPSIIAQFNDPMMLLYFDPFSLSTKSVLLRRIVRTGDLRSIRPMTPVDERSTGRLGVVIATTQDGLEVPGDNRLMIVSHMCDLGRSVLTLSDKT